MTSRRGFLSAIIVSASAPAIVRAEHLMNIARPAQLWVPLSPVIFQCGLLPCGGMWQRVGNIITVSSGEMHIPPTILEQIGMDPLTATGFSYEAGTNLQGFAK